MGFQVVLQQIKVYDSLVTNQTWRRPKIDFLGHRNVQNRFSRWFWFVTDSKSVTTLKNNKICTFFKPTFQFSCKNDFPAKTFPIELSVKSPNAYKLIENRNHMPAHGSTNPSLYTPRKTTFFGLALICLRYRCKSRLVSLVPAWASYG